MERLITGEIVHISLHEANVAESHRRHPFSGSRNRVSVPVNANHFAGWPHEPRNQHGNISQTRAEIENALTGSDACFAEEPLSDGRDQG
jgi:hypothetical protein